MNQKPGWKYEYIESLEQYIAINEITNVLYTEDKTRYSPEECKLLCSINCQLPKQIHIIKKIFCGEIISIE